MRSFATYITNKEKQFAKSSHPFDRSKLDPRFVKYYENGDRIKVTIYGVVKTGTVGITTGWKPVFLLLRDRRSVGSSDILDAGVELVAEKLGGQYIPVLNT